jgi:hypothetical protein
MERIWSRLGSARRSGCIIYARNWFTDWSQNTQTPHDTNVSRKKILMMWNSKTKQKPSCQNQSYICQEAAEAGCGNEITHRLIFIHGAGQLQRKYQLCQCWREGQGREDSGSLSRIELSTFSFLEGVQAASASLGTCPWEGQSYEQWTGEGEEHLAACPCRTLRGGLRVLIEEGIFWVQPGSLAFRYLDVASVPFQCRLISSHRDSCGSFLWNLHGYD